MAGARILMMKKTKLRKSLEEDLIVTVQGLVNGLEILVDDDEADIAVKVKLLMKVSSDGRIRMMTKRLKPIVDMLFKASDKIDWYDSMLDRYMENEDLDT